MVSVRTSNEEGAAEDIVGSNPTSDAKKLKPTESGTTLRRLLKCTEERFMERRYPNYEKKCKWCTMRDHDNYHGNWLRIPEYTPSLFIFV